MTNVGRSKTPFVVNAIKLDVVPAAANRLIALDTTAIEQ